MTLGSHCAAQEKDSKIAHALLESMHAMTAVNNSTLPWMFEDFHISNNNCSSHLLCEFPVSCTLRTKRQLICWMLSIYGKGTNKIFWVFWYGVHKMPLGKYNIDRLAECLKVRTLIVLEIQTWRKIDSAGNKQLASGVKGRTKSGRIFVWMVSTPYQQALSNALSNEIKGTWELRATSEGKMYRAILSTPSLPTAICVCRKCQQLADVYIKRLYTAIQKICMDICLLITVHHLSENLLP